jgi:hypothetical protein
VLAVVAIVVKRRWRNVLNVVHVVRASIARVLYNTACMFDAHTDRVPRTRKTTYNQTDSNRLVLTVTLNALAVDARTLSCFPCTFDMQCRELT